jgi:hypothetical protein
VAARVEAAASRSVSVNLPNVLIENPEHFWQMVFSGLVIAAVICMVAATGAWIWGQRKWASSLLMLWGLCTLPIVGVVVACVLPLALPKGILLTTLQLCCVVLGGMLSILGIIMFFSGD